MTRRKRTAFLAVLAAVCAVTIGAVATGAAPLGTGPALSDVPTANTRSPGFSPASKLSAELSQVAVAQGSTKLENTTAQVSYYGYDNDVLNAAGEPQMLPTAAVSDEAQKTEPDKNTYLVFKNGLPGADPHYDYGTHFLFQGHEVGNARLHHADQPRRRRRSPRHAACDRGRERRPARGHRRVDLGPVGRAAPVHDRG